MGRHSTPASGIGRWPWLLAGAVFLVVALVLVLVPRLLRDSGPPGATAPTSVATTAVPTTASSPAPTPSPTPTTPAPAEVTIAFAGDVHFTGRTAGLLADPQTAFGPIAETLAAADLAMLNLETAITERGREEPKEFHFRAPASAFTAAAAAGVDVVSLANNHAVDYGRAGLTDTLAAAADAPVGVVGVGADAAAAYAPFRATVGDITVAFFGVSQIPDRTYQAWTATDTDPGIASTADTDRLLAGVGAAAQAGDVVVVYLHWGVEGQTCPTPEMSGLARDLAAAGADIVIGTHAHLLLGSGWLGSGAATAYVGYGLGNFLWWRSQAFSDDTGVLTVTVRDGRPVAAEFTPAVIDDAGRPVPVTGGEAARIQDALIGLLGCTGLRPAP